MPDLDAINTIASPLQQQVQGITAQDIAALSLSVPAMPNVFTATPATATPERPAEPASNIAPVHVKITMDPVTRVVTITGAEPLPPWKTILEYLPQKYHKHLKYTYNQRGVGFCIAATWEVIPVQAWADAIGEAVLHARANAQGATYEAKSLDEAFVAMGDRLYKLSPVSLIKTNSALAAVRKVARMKLDRELVKLKNDAVINNQALVNEGLRMRAEAQKVLDAARAEAARKPAVPPQFAIDNHIPIMHANLDGTPRWLVQMVIDFRIDHFDVKFYSERVARNLTYTWKALIAPSRPIHLWVPLREGGGWIKDSIYVDTLDPEIPHISHSQACFSLGQSIRVETIEDYWTLQEAIARAMRGVQLDSLRVGVTGWLPVFKAFVPEPLYSALKRGGWGDAEQLARELDRTTAPAETPQSGEIWTTTATR